MTSVNTPMSRDDVLKTFAPLLQSFGQGPAQVATKAEAAEQARDLWSGVPAIEPGAADITTELKPVPGPKPPPSSTASSSSASTRTSSATSSPRP